MICRALKPFFLPAHHYYRKILILFTVMLNKMSVCLRFQVVPIYVHVLPWAAATYRSIAVIYNVWVWAYLLRSWTKKKKALSVNLVNWLATKPFLRCRFIFGTMKITRSIKRLILINTRIFGAIQIEPKSPHKAA